MSSDGADLGMDAESAMKAAMGAEEEKPRRTTGEMAAVIRATTSDPHTYYGTANYCAKLILDWLEADPRRAQSPTENVYKEEDGQLVYGDEGGLILVEHGWYERMKGDGMFPEGGLDLTGFMWGWAVNAARTILELPAVPNPAIMTIG